MHCLFSHKLRKKNKIRDEKLKFSHVNQHVTVSFLFDTFSRCPNRTRETIRSYLIFEKEKRSKYYLGNRVSRILKIRKRTKGDNDLLSSLYIFSETKQTRKELVIGRVRVRESF